jgi:hypothetical protein
MVKIERGFSPADRYLYDFKLCTIERGWAQVDTSQDASYYGTWISPEKRQIFQYVEGDLYLTRCDTDAELAAEILRMKEWNTSMGHRFMGIDPGFNADLKAALCAAGLAEYLH